MEFQFINPSIRIEKKPAVFDETKDAMIFMADALDVARSLPDESIDLIIADPPYFRVYGAFDFCMFETEQSYLQWCETWLWQCRRILKNNGTLILWGSLGKRMITFARIAIMIEDKAMFKRQNWVTQRNSRGIGHAKNYMSSREDFLFLTKSDTYTFHAPYTAERTNRKDCGKNGKPRKSPFKRVSNVWIDIAEASQSSLERCFHPTVKAQKLCDRIITTHSNVNDLLFIPFSGAGSEIISALRHERKAIGCEINHLYFDESVKRITKWTKRSAHATFKSQWPAYCF